MTRLLAACYAVGLGACLSSGSQPIGKIAGATSGKVGQVLQLDGTGSTDKNKNGLTYAWHFVSVPTGSSPGFNDPHAPAPTFAPDVEGKFVIQLIVTDGLASDSVTTTITAAGNCFIVSPTVNANQGEKAVMVTVDPSCASPQAEFQWQLLQRPTGSTATVTGNTLDPILVPDLAGTYTVSYSIKYGFGDFGVPKTLSVTAASCAPSAPITTNSDLVSVGEPAYLNAALATSSPCGHVVTKSKWSLVNAPSNSAGQTLFLSGGSRGAAAAFSSLSTTLLGGVAGKYTVDLAVTDDHGVTSHDEHSIVMTPPVTKEDYNQAPPDFSFALDPTTNQPAVAYAYNSSLVFAELDATSSVWDSQVAVLPSVGATSVHYPDPFGFAVVFYNQQPCIVFLENNEASAHAFVELSCRGSDGKTWPTSYVQVYDGTTNAADNYFVAAAAVPGATSSTLGVLFHVTLTGPDYQLNYVVCSGTSSITCTAPGAATFTSVTAATADVSSGALVVTPNNQLRVAYYDSQAFSATVGGIVLKQCNGSNCSTAKTAKVTDTLAATTPFSVAAGNDTNVSVLYTQKGTGTLNYEDCTLASAACNPGQPEVVLANSRYAVPAVVVDGAGNVNALWNDTEAFDLVRGQRDAPNLWALSPQRMFIPDDSSSSGGNIDAFAEVYSDALTLTQTTGGGLMAVYSTDFWHYLDGYFTPFPQGIRVWQRAQ